MKPQVTILITICLLVAGSLMSGCTVTIPDSTQALMAVQNAEAELAQGLAQYLKTITLKLTDPAELSKAASLYNDAVAANNAVASNLNLQLAQPGVAALNANSVDPLSEKAINKLLNFREFAQQIGSLTDLDPIPNARSLTTPKTKAAPVAVATAIVVAKEVFKWWLEENERQRSALSEHLKTYNMPQWIGIE